MEEDPAKPGLKKQKIKGIYLRQGIYYVSFYYHDEFGRRKRFRQAVGPNKKEAETYLGKKRTESREKKLFNVQKDVKITFEEFGKEYVERHSRIYNKSFATDEHRLKNLNKIFGSKYLFEITPKDIEDYKMVRLKDDIKAATINRDLALVRSMLNRAKEWGRLVRPNPCANMRKLRENNERLRFLSEDEIARLYCECRGELLAFVTFAVNTGCRRGEILALSWSDIDIQLSQIYIRDSKSGRGRVIPMNETVKRLILSLKKTLGSPIIFGSHHREAFDAALKRAKIEGASFHTLRHSFASHLVMRGVDLVTVSRLLGHTTIQMTMRYSHLSPEHQVKAVGVLDSFLGPKSLKVDTNRSQTRISEVEYDLYNVVSLISKAS